MLLKNTLLYGAADAIFKLFSFFTFPFFAYMLTLEDFGWMTLLLTLTAIIPYLYCGVNNALHRFYFEEEKSHILVSTCFWGQFLISCGINCIGALFSLHEPALAIGFLANIPLQIMVFGNDFLRLHFTPWKVSLTMGSQVFSLFLFSFLFVVVVPMQVLGVMMALFCSNMVAALVSLIFLRQELIFSIDAAKLKKMWRFAYPFAFTGIGYWIFSFLDRLMIDYFSGEGEVGLYGAAFKIVAPLLLLQGAFGAAWSPTAMRLLQSQKNNTQVVQIDLLVRFLYLFVAFVISLFATDILQLLTPSPYWGAAKIVPWLALGLVAYGTTQVSALGITLSNKTLYLTFGIYGACFCNLLLNLLLIPLYGAVGAAIATAISSLFLTTLYTALSERLYSIGFLQRVGFLILSAGFLLMPLTLFLQESPIFVRVLLALFAAFPILWGRSLFKQLQQDFSH